MHCSAHRHTSNSSASLKLYFFLLPIFFLFASFITPFHAMRNFNTLTNIILYISVVYTHTTHGSALCSCNY